MLNRKNLSTFISEIYGVEAEYPWIKYPGFAVYRHDSNKKWFAVVMNLNKSKLGLSSDETVDVVNLKCDPIMIGSLLKEKGIFPGYHMNKSYWITVFLDGSVEDEKIKWLVDLSYDLTNVKIKKNNCFLSN
ncbi:MAG: MmcQ/YjbR family DNA-binding protein [Clostridia bacterium]|nr:MmcQ/YjbR family DNA-binding protein [Clostridia bacterium]